METLVGTRWDAEKFNCWHMVQAWYKKELGVYLPDFVISPEDVLSVAKAFRGEQGRSGSWQELLVPSHGCIVAMGRNKHVTHAGIWLQDENVLHCSRDAGACVIQKIQTLRRQWNTIKFYEFIQ